MNENDPLMAIANIDGLDRPLQKTIQAALEEQGMDPLIEGSVMYMVAVKQSEIPRAMDVLKNDERLVGKKIIFFKPFKVNVTN